MEQLQRFCVWIWIDKGCCYAAHEGSEPWKESSAVETWGQNVLGITRISRSWVAEGHGHLDLSRQPWHVVQEVGTFFPLLVKWEQGVAPRSAGEYAMVHWWGRDLLRTLAQWEPRQRRFWLRALPIKVGEEPAGAFQVKG